MIELHETIQVPRSAADCYRYLKDFSSIQQWDPGVYRAWKTTSGEAQVGSEFKVIITNALRQRSEAHYVLQQAELNSRLVFTAEHAHFNGIDEISLQPISDQETQISYRAELNFSTAAALAAQAGKPLLNHIGKAAVTGLQQALVGEVVARPLDSSQKLANKLVLPASWAFTERGYLDMPNRGLSHFIDSETAVVTGATSGIGLATACELARLGATLVLVGRDLTKLNQARAEIMDFAGRDDLSRFDIVEADLSLMAEARQAAETIKLRHPRIDILINNAGALFPERACTAEGHEQSMAINLYAPWLLVQSLWPQLLDSGTKVINVASGGMYLQPLVLSDMNFEKGSYDGSKAYARAKRGLVGLTEYWAKKAANSSASFNAMHPGWAATPGVSKSLPGFNKVMKPLLRDAQMGADTIVWLATSPAAEQRSGEFWFDRQARPTAVIANTELTAEKTQKLVSWLTDNVSKSSLSNQT